MSEYSREYGVKLTEPANGKVQYKTQVQPGRSIQSEAEAISEAKNGFNQYFMPVPVYRSVIKGDWQRVVIPEEEFDMEAEDAKIRSLPSHQLRRAAAQLRVHADEQALRPIPDWVLDLARNPEEDTRLPMEKIRDDILQAAKSFPDMRFNLRETARLYGVNMATIHFLVKELADKGELVWSGREFWRLPEPPKRGWHHETTKRLVKEGIVKAPHRWFGINDRARFFNVTEDQMRTIVQELEAEGVIVTEITKFKAAS